MNDEKWYAKLIRWIELCAAVFTILGISVSGLWKNYGAKIRDMFSDNKNNQYVTESLEGSGSETLKETNVEYKNELKIFVECASLLLEDANEEYIPVDTAQIDLDNDMHCTIYNADTSYSAEIVDDYYSFSNVEPGEYVICFDDSANRYQKQEINLKVDDTSELSSIIYTQYNNFSKYENYTIRYDAYANMHYNFMNQRGDETFIDNLFMTDANGEFQFLVDWNLNPKVHIHSVTGGHMSVLIDEKYNGAHFIN